MGYCFFLLWVFWFSNIYVLLLNFILFISLMKWKLCLKDFGFGIIVNIYIGIMVNFVFSEVIKLEIKYFKY